MTEPGLPTPEGYFGKCFQHDTPAHFGSSQFPFDKSNGNFGKSCLRGMGCQNHLDLKTIAIGCNCIQIETTDEVRGINPKPAREVAKREFEGFSGI